VNTEELKQLNKLLHDLEDHIRTTGMPRKHLLDIKLTQRLVVSVHEKVYNDGD
jgi:hypothetical protein